MPPLQRSPCEKNCVPNSCTARLELVLSYDNDNDTQRSPTPVNEGLALQA